eukprot:TRINITY_DN43233_c0_g1_i1.p1 TRINITY_DN43233_c0_g1~~TRINITY_DN43233_c0_g1_i1.p1  ORF type:complete len:261 (-),score=28.55 TRINITY_DN43233_c0_g1_i1:399-1181(-)
MSQTSDPSVSRLVLARPHRDDGSTDESADEPLDECQSVGTSKVNQDGDSDTTSRFQAACSSLDSNRGSSGAPSTAAVPAGVTNDTRGAVGARGGGGGGGGGGARLARWLPSPMSARGSCGITPMACFSGVVGISAAAAPGSRSQVRSPKAGCYVGCTGGAAARLAHRGNSWVCAVLPADSGSDGETGAASHAGYLETDSVNDDGIPGGATSSTSTGTPPLHGTMTPPAASIGGSDTRSDFSGRAVGAPQVSNSVYTTRAM